MQAAGYNGARTVLLIDFSKVTQKINTALIREAYAF